MGQKEFLKVPPHNLEAERALLGGLLLRGDALMEVLEVLRGDEFYMPAHTTLFKTMVELFEKSLPIDMVTVTDHLKADDGLKKIGGSSYLVELTREIGDAANVAHYATIVAKKSSLRSLLNAAVEVEALCYDPGADEKEVLDTAQHRVFEVVERGIKPSYYEIKEVMKISIKEAERAFELKSPITGIPTQYKKLDEMTGGLQNADLIILAGRPSMGKTALALNIACNAAMPKDHDREPVPVAFFSLEMSKEQIGMRLLSSRAGVESRKLRTGFFSPEDWGKLLRAADRLSQAPIFIDDSAALSNLEVRAKARRLKQDKRLGLVVIDYLQLMRHAGKVERRDLEISEISMSLKALAKELSIPVVALSQLNRRVEERPNKRPILADLRESGALEQDADVIMFLYRDWIYKKDPEMTDEEKNRVELIIGKQRNGPTGTVIMTFVDKFTRFSEPAKQEPGGDF